MKWCVVHWVHLVRLCAPKQHFEKCVDVRTHRAKPTAVAISCLSPKNTCQAVVCSNYQKNTTSVSLFLIMTSNSQLPVVSIHCPSSVACTYNFQIHWRVTNTASAKVFVKWIHSCLVSSSINSWHIYACISIYGTLSLNDLYTSLRLINIKHFHVCTLTPFYLNIPNIKQATAWGLPWYDM